MKNLIGVILSSGQAEEIKISNKPAGIHLADMLSDLGIETYITQSPSKSTKHQVLSDIYKDVGSIHAVIQQLEATNKTLALFIPEDMPLIDEGIVKQLLDTYEEEDTIVCFRQHGTPYIEPFPAIFDIEVLKLLITDVADGTISIQNLMNHVGSHLLEIPADQKLLNASDPDERKKIIGLLT